jgi:acetyl-CoA acyltransferase
MEQAVIIDCLRTPVGKAPRGSLRNVRPDEMAAQVIRTLVDRYPQVPKDEIDDVILGCAMPEAEQGLNFARIAGLAAGLPDSVPGMTINRFCSSGLQAIALAAERIQGGAAQAIVAGGSESMSLLPRSGHGFAPNPALVETHPEIYMGMGQTAERLYRRYNISREDQDQFSLRSHQRAIAAQKAGKFDEEIVPLTWEERVVENGGSAKQSVTFSQVNQSFTFTKDEGPRADTSMEALGKLKAVFHAKGSVTAGNSSQTSDGAAAALVTSAKQARAWGLKPKARFVSFAVAGVPPEIMGIGPVVAIPKALALAGLTLKDVGLIELNEAFAVQALAVIRTAGLDEEIVNVNGGAIALGHPLGCTGAKLVATLLREMHRRQVEFGLITMCVGGGQGAAGIVQLA